MKNVVWGFNENTKLLIRSSEVPLRILMIFNYCEVINISRPRPNIKSP